MEKAEPWNTFYERLYIAICETEQRKKRHRDAEQEFEKFKHTTGNAWVLLFHYLQIGLATTRDIEELWKCPRSTTTYRLSRLRKMNKITFRRIKRQLRGGGYIYEWRLKKC